MWLFMYLCYGLSALTLTGLTVALVQGLTGRPVIGASHASFSFLITLIYLFTETLVMFFFVGTGSNVKEYVRERKLSESLISRIGGARHRVTMEASLSILLVLGTAVLGGAVAGSNVPRQIHLGAAVVAYLHFLWMLRNQHRAYRLATEVVTDMVAESGETVDTPS